MPLNPLEVVGGIAIGEGVGSAVADVVEPQLRDLKNQQSAKHPDKPLDVGQAALAAIKGFTTALDLAAEARKDGFDGDHFAVIEQNLRVFPATAELLELWRRERLTPGEVETALQRERIPEPYRTAILDLFSERLDPAVIATAIQRGIMRDPGILPVGPPGGTGKVPRFPVSPLDPLKEAKASGINEERLFVETAIVGLPASPDLAARATFRKIIERVDFDRAISEGNTRNEWRDAIFEAFREILTANQYAELELRGFLNREERLAETDKHGMSHRDSDLLYNVLGRSIPVRQILTGEARGGTYDGPIDGIPDAFLASMRRGNLRPEYYNLAYANRYSYPSAFVLRALTEAGDLTQAESHQVLLDIGWKPELAAKVSARWAGGVGVAADPNVKKAQTQLWTATHRSYIAGESDEATVQGRLGQLGIPEPAQLDILTLWGSERELVRKQLSAADVRKAYQQLDTNAATGQPWTRADAFAALLDRGWGSDDANSYLDIPYKG